jgi:poly(3-hydroxybutyrate) depolymerase
MDQRRPSPRLTRRLPLLSALLLAGAGASTARAQLTPKTLVYQGVTRTWYEHVPASYKGSRPVPLVLALHGSNNSGDQFGPASEWMPVSDAAGFIVVFPNGGQPVSTNFSWNSWSYDGKAPDDAGFLLALIEELKQDYRIDGARVYMTGFSNGGGMTTTFAQMHASVLAGIALVSGGWVPRPGMPEPEAPLPVWMWRGTAEKLEKTPEELTQMDMSQLLLWVSSNRDKSPPNIYRQPPYTTSTYRGGKAEVRYTTIEGAGHDYTSGTAEKVWNGFFAVFSRRGTAIVYHPPK